MSQGHFGVAWRPEEEEGGRGTGLKDGEARRGQSAGVDVLRVCGAVQGGLGGAAVDFRKRVLQELNGGQDLRRHLTMLASEPSQDHTPIC